MSEQTRLPASDIAKTCLVGGATYAYDALNDPIGSPDEGATSITCDVDNQYARVGFDAFTVPSNAAINYLRLTFRIATAITGTGSPESVAPYLVIDGSYYAGTVRSITAWTTYTQDWTTNPRTGEPWTVDDINGSGNDPLQALQLTLGFQDDGKGNSAAAQCTQAYFTVDYTTGETFNKSGSLPGSGAITGAPQRVRNPEAVEVAGAGAVAGTTTVNHAYPMDGAIEGAGDIAGIVSLKYSHSGTLPASGDLTGEAQVVSPSGGGYAFVNGPGVIAGRPHTWAG